MKNVLNLLFGNDIAAQPLIAHYEVKFYAADVLQATWLATEVHETVHGYSFVDKETGNVITVSGSVKITGVLTSNASTSTSTS